MNFSCMIPSTDIDHDLQSPVQNKSQSRFLKPEHITMELASNSMAMGMTMDSTMSMCAIIIGIIIIQCQ